MTDPDAASLRDELPSEVSPDTVLLALLRCGRWAEAANYAPRVDGLRPQWHCALLLAAGRSTEDAHAALHPPGADHGDEDQALTRFLDCAVRVLRGDGTSFGDLIGGAAQVGRDPVLSEIMLRAADAVGEPGAAAHFARDVLATHRGDPLAALVAGVELVSKREYVAAVRFVDQTSRVRFADDADPLDAVLGRLDPARATALVSIGNFAHREKDPTRPVDADTRAARDRWRAAYRVRDRRRTARLAGRAVLTAAGVAASLYLGTPLPVAAVAVALYLWSRMRPLPGLDAQTSQLVRTVNDPMQILRQRRYRPVDILVFVLTLVISACLLAALPHGPHWVTPLEFIAPFVLAGLLTRTRRRWIRHERNRLLDNQTIPGCRCLDTSILRGPTSREYVDSHLFELGVPPGAPPASSAGSRWRLMQCLTTFIRFLDIPDGQVAVRLPVPPPRQTADR